MLVILAVSAIIIPMIQGVWLDSQLEYQFNRYRMNQLQARYNAKSGVGLSLLRIYIFKGVEKSLSGQWLSITRPLLDQLWVFPFFWPFSASEELLESENQDLQIITKQSFLKGAYRASIFPEDGLLDVNDLSSPLTPLREFTYKSLFNLLLNSMEERKELKDKYGAKVLEEILNNLSDWTDLDNDSQNGGSENLLEDGKKPLNRSFISIEEIKKVPGVTMEIFEILKPHITVYGAKSLNINYTSKEILQALKIPEDLADQILFRTQMNSDHYNPFLNQEAFCDFMEKMNFSFCEELNDQYKTLEVLRFGYPIAFRIKSSGEYKGNIAKLETLIYDLSPMALNYQKFLYHEKQRQKQEEAGTAGPSEQRSGIRSGEKTPAQKLEQSKRPKIDYSYYESLIIMYLKEGF